MPRRVTIDDILSTGEKDLPIPGLLGADGEAVTLRVRKVSAGERDALLPQLPAHLYEDLPEDEDVRQKELTERRRLWLERLTPEQIEARTQEASHFFARLVARASVDPVLTEAQAERLGDALVELGNEIMAFSKNKPTPAKPETSAG